MLGPYVVRHVWAKHTPEIILTGNPKVINLETRCGIETFCNKILQLHIMWYKFKFQPSQIESLKQRFRLDSSVKWLLAEAAALVVGNKQISHKQLGW